MFANSDVIADRLSSWGYVTLAIDSLGPRVSGIANRCGKGLPEQAFDAYAALHYLSQLDFVDPARVAVFGQSMGAAYGGRRWWFQCPRTGRRTTKLYLPNGGRHFWSRQAYGLGYASQREGRFDRLQRRAAMLNRQLGGKGWATWESPPSKPKWMRWRTYERKYEGWRRVVERADAEFTIKAMRILRRPAMPIPIGRRRQPHR